MSDALPLMCGNEDHPRPTKAITQLSYPDGRYRSTTACVGCMTWAVRAALDEGRPIVVGPVTDWEIENPPRASIVLSRLTSRLDAFDKVETCE